MHRLSLVVFIIASAAHLYASWKDQAKWRARTKPLLLGLLLLFYVTAGKPLCVFLVLALAASWLGDILLIPKGNTWFAAGGVSFMLAHAFLILVFLEGIIKELVRWPLAILLAAVYGSVSAMIVRALRGTVPGRMKFPMYFYLLCNTAMNVFACMQMITLGKTGAAVSFIGAVLFFISDCTLFLVRYYKKPEIVFRKHFTVMLTYLAGEFLITQGKIMLG